MTQTDLADQLAAILEAVGWQNTAISAVERLSAGTNRETFKVAGIRDVGAGDEPIGLILQRSRVGADPRLSSCLREGQLLEQLAGGDTLAPTVVAMGGADSPLGRDFVITRAIEGETIARKILRDDHLEAARASAVSDCAQALAAIHRTPLDTVSQFLPRVTDPVAAQRELWDALDRPEPVFSYAFAWLERTRPADSATTLVHGDFRLGNLIVDERGLAAVLDWELAHTGDPALDLGWFCAAPWRFGSDQPAGGLGSRQALLEAYRDAGGEPIDMQRLLWWEVLANVRWGIICAQMGFAAPFAGSGALELSVVGRRFSEAEYDTLAAISQAETWRTGNSDDATLPCVELAGLPKSDGTSTPSGKAGLVSVVGDYLEGLGERVSGGDRWQLRIARNALEIAERERILGPTINERAAARFRALGVSDERQWCRRLELNQTDGDDIAALWDLTADHLAIDHPGYGSPG